jgi:asparagine synthase (glutamine-hydrolysing)
MCGIAGFYSKNLNINYKTILTEMGLSLNKRGPDDSGIWFESSKGIGLSHRRLSILDLTISGHQPMLSIDKRFIIIFNGEIYNHNEIRNTINVEYSYKNWRSTSDTETILVALEYYGVDKTISMLIGMFAIAIWDNVNDQLIICRDRVGEKPLYYGWQNNSFLFASELKAFQKHPDFNKIIDKNALALFFKYNYVPYPFSIYEGIKKLQPGTILKLDIKTNKFDIKKYWNFEEVVFNNSTSFKDGNNKFDYTSHLKNILIESVKSQMQSDVPLGAFLSGGIDSTLIVAIMQSISNVPIKTFTIGYEDINYNEANHAKRIANFLNTDHTEYILKPDEAIKIIPLLSKIYDEPFSDASQIPTFIVSRLAKTKVTVSLSGDGGDELFAGYNRYFMTNKLWPKLQLIPLVIRKYVSLTILLISPNKWNFIKKILFFLPKKIKNIKNLGDKIHKIANLLTASSQIQLYDKFISHWSLEDHVVIGNTNFEIEKYEQFNKLSDIERMMAIDTLTYLPDDILVKVDRAAMYNSLETRVPFLDRRIIEYAWKIPLKIKLNKNSSKDILKKILYNYVPKNLIDRPKMGFGVPIDNWLRGPLKNWAEDLLNEDEIRNDGLLNYAIIKKKWDEHICGKRNWQYHIWDVLMFQTWYRQQK